MYDPRSQKRIADSVLKTERMIPDRLLQDNQNLKLGHFGIVRGRITTPFTGTTGTMLLREVVALGENSPFPGTEIVVVNVNKDAGEVGTAYAIYHYAADFPGTGTGNGHGTGTGTGDGNWELLTFMGAADDEPGVLAILYKTLPPATVNYSIAGTSAALFGVTPGDLVEQAVIPLVWTGNSYQGDEWQEPSHQGAVGEVIRLPAENHCWETAIVGGEAVGTATGEPPILVRGHRYRSTGTGTGTGERTSLYYAVTEVITPLVVYYGYATGSTSGGPIPVSPLSAIHGKIPTGTRSAENALGWEVDEGSVVIVLRGLTASGVLYVALNVECPAGTGT